MDYSFECRNPECGQKTFPKGLAWRHGRLTAFCRHCDREHELCALPGAATPGEGRYAVVALSSGVP